LKPLVLMCVLAGALFAGSSLTYTKTFPGSTPAYIQIALSEDGAGVYKEAPDDDNPIRFQLAEAERNQILGLAQKLDHFSRPLESHLKVANMGMKTFHYEDADGAHEEKFNYSEDPDAKALNDLFESIVESERALIGLETAVKFDKLGAQDAILRVEVLRDQKRLMAAQQFLPMLDRVVKNESFLHMARDRAAALADDIRRAK
jgi:hypothetical protein